MQLKSLHIATGECNGCDSIEGEDQTGHGGASECQPSPSFVGLYADSDPSTIYWCVTLQVLFGFFGIFFFFFFFFWGGGFGGCLFKAIGIIECKPPHYILLRGLHKCYLWVCYIFHYFTKMRLCS